MKVKPFKEELLELMTKHSKEDDYVNPHLIKGIINTLEEVYGEDYDELWDWARDNWEK